VSSAAQDDPGGGDWVAAMRAGDFAAAWAIADRDLARLRKEGPPKHEGPRHLQRIWRGEQLAGKSVLVRCYHGLGDTIQFARFLPALKEIARKVTVWCQPPLVGLIAGVPGVDRVIALHDGTPEVMFDADIEIMELPHALRAGRDLIELRSPYLTSADPRSAPPREGPYAVGLVWRVGDWDKRREVPASALQCLALPGIRLFSLQRDAPPYDIASIGAIDISTPDVEILASRLQKLDLVISVDTMVAHLAAARGRETWIMLHADCDWRWPATGSRTYWYPHARLFRQRTLGDWSSVIAELRATLQARVRALVTTSPGHPASSASAGESPVAAPVAATEDNPA
jgi:hypothetical protein